MAPTRSEPDSPTLRLADVRVRLGSSSAPGGSSVVLDGVSFEVRPGQVVSVTGAAGAGKSTVFNAVCGFVRPESGAIAWRGVPLRPRPQRLTTLGLARTLQGVGLYGGLTVLQNLMVGSVGVPRVPAVPAGRRGGLAAGLLGAVRLRPDERARALDYLARLGLGEYAEAELAAVPEALQVRVILARALVAEPELLLLDDPSVGTDLGMKELAALIRGLPSVPITTGGTKRSVLLCTGSLELAFAASDLVVMLERGKVVAIGTPTELQRVPAP
jgi:branched-chain amino acid transport system ATP-binding protein